MSNIGTASYELLMALKNLGGANFGDKFHVATVYLDDADFERAAESVTAMSRADSFPPVTGETRNRVRTAFTINGIKFCRRLRMRR